MAPDAAGHTHEPQVLREQSESATAAFFDVDGTLVSTTIVHYYIYFRRRLMARWNVPLWQAAYYLRCLYYLYLDRVNRSRMNTVFYNDYAGLDAGAVRNLADDCFRELIEPHVFPEGAACVRELRRSGVRVVLVTGSLDFIIEPLARSLGVADVIAAQMSENQGLLTGTLVGPPIGEQIKAERIKAFARQESIDLSRSLAYGDSIADVPMLECVGHPHVVNPDRALTAIACAQGWPAHRWTRKQAVTSVVAVR